MWNDHLYYLCHYIKPPSSEQVAATPAISAEVQEFLNNLAPADVVEINESGKVSYYEVLSLDEFRLTAHVKNIESSEHLFSPFCF